jgi:hypothetical protein
MKTLILLIFTSIISFAISTNNEKHQDTVIEISSNQSDYGPWRTTSCYRGLDYCVKRASYNESARKYEWWVKFRNRYQEDISFNYVLKESNVNGAAGTDRGTVKKGSISSGSWFLVADPNSVSVFIDKVRFGEDNWSDKYANCDN